MDLAKARYNILHFLKKNISNGVNVYYRKPRTLCISDEFFSLLFTIGHNNVDGDRVKRNTYKNPILRKPKKEKLFLQNNWTFDLHTD